jgi:hypothetical protein
MVWLRLLILRKEMDNEGLVKARGHSMPVAAQYGVTGGMFAFRQR